MSEEHFTVSNLLAQFHTILL